MFGCCNNRCRCRCGCGFNDFCIPVQCIPGFPGFPGFPPVEFELGGVVTGVDGTPLSGVQIMYTVNGVPETTVTNGNGTYTIKVPANANVGITAVPGLGVIVIPTSYNITGVNGNIYGFDFRFTPLSP